MGARKERASMEQSPLLPLREELAQVTPYGAPQLDVAARLNVNENPYPPSPGMIADITQAVARAAEGLNRYPDRDFTALRKALAGYVRRESGLSFPVEQIWAANGSNEVMAQLLGAYAGPGRTVLGTEYSYSMYPEYVRGAHSRYVRVPRRSDYNVDVDALLQGLREVSPSVLLLANPNNPTGTASSEAELIQILQQARETGPVIDDRRTATVVVVDEAYAEFRSPGQPSALALLEKFPHLVVSRTMSKSFGMAGLRLGYLVAAPEVIADIMRVRLPYHLSALTQAAAIAALGHAEEQLRQLAELRERRDNLASWLESKGYTVPRTQANFVLFGPFPDRHQIFSDLLDRGVLIREVGPEGFLRVSIGTSQEDQAFRQALEEVTR
ncbi:histidinol-phosphate transaminase [Varibaculum prostatecancerukia]|uniref:histidinol-phosphate transaminase n=2 Tax=Varibaculum prostatecancerukia TaxID=2811781 RepID=UPI002869145C|nr:histidinol-phosphate transaminase [Varibaculum prostatecancerukia]